MRVRKDNHVILVKNLHMMAEMRKYYSVSVSITLPDKVHTIGLLKSFVGYTSPRIQQHIRDFHWDAGAKFKS